MDNIASTLLKQLSALLLCFFLVASIAVPVVASSNQEQYVASVNSDVYHIVGCGQADRIRGYNRIYFSSRNEAIASGRRACYYCGGGSVSADNVTDSEYNHSSSNSGEKTDTTNTREGSKTDKQLFSVFGFAMNIALWFLARKLSISFRFLDAAYSRLPDCIVTMICFILAILLCFALLFIVLECGGLVYEALLEKNIRKAVLIVLADIVCIFIWEPTTRK